jgi:N-hydroxyarylamine O-acetyltransferase
LASSQVTRVDYDDVAGRWPQFPEHDKSVGMTSLDLDAYFNRIGYFGLAPATLSTLRRLQALHATAIAFENLDPLMGRPVSLSIPALSKKFLDQRRGGYCFEQNTFFQDILRSVGFSVSGLAASIQWNRPPSQYSPRIHMVLRVNLPEGQFIVDVGFGGFSLTAPLLLVPHIEQATTHEWFRLIPIDGQFQVQVKLRGSWKSVYQLSLQELSSDDYAGYNWFTSTNPDVVFANCLMAARPAGGLRYGLFDNELSIHHLNGETERRKLDSSSELASVLEDLFRIRLPDGCGPVLERLTQKNAKRVVAGP